MVVRSIDVRQAESVPADELMRDLDASSSGLTSTQAQQRTAQFGRNILAEHKTSPLRQFLSYFWGPIPWMIEVAAVLSAAIGHWDDLTIIAVLLVFNALIGFWEEHKAANALDALKDQLAVKARTLRDGAWQDIDAADLVPGDVVRLRLGDVIPADAKLIDGGYLSVDQSALTGESLPVSKKIGEVVYSGSVAKQGEMVALITATGSDTFFGRTARLVQDAGTTSHFQKAVMRIGDFLIFVALALSIVLIGVELYRGEPVLDLLQFVLVLVIASIPVAMPAVLSVTLALGALALSQRKAIVSRLQSIEEMAGVDILCSDKTGTLTQNQLTLGEPIPFRAPDPQSLILAAALASQTENEDAIDLAVVAGLTDRSVLDDYTQTGFTPFDPVSKRTEARVNDSGGGTFQVTKGAPHVVMDLARLTGEPAERAQRLVKDLAAKGYRTLAVARSDDDGATWTYLGILPLSDPPRPDSAQTIRAAVEHGIGVKMVTGDDIAIAQEISGQLGLGRGIQPATDLFDGKNVQANVGERIERADGFARVFPEHKYGIVKALQDRDHLVAMTGDGVNDAPALKQADVGIAVSGATDAARAAADLILTAPGLSVIIRAVEEARRIFARMTSYTVYRIAMTIDIMLFVVLAMLILDIYPLTPVMIIILALLDDIPIMTIAYDNTWLSPKPTRWDMHRVLSLASILGFVSVAQSFGLMYVGDRILDMDVSHLQSAVFLQLVVGGHLMLLVVRNRGSFWRSPYPAWPLFGVIVATQLFAVLMTGFGWLVTSLPWSQIGWIWLYNLVWMVALDFVKLGSNRLIDHRVSFKQRFLTRANQPLHRYQPAR